MTLKAASGAGASSLAVALVAAPLLVAGLAHAQAAAPPVEPVQAAAADPSAQVEEIIVTKFRQSPARRLSWPSRHETKEQPQ